MTAVVLLLCSFTARADADPAPHPIDMTAVMMGDQGVPLKDVADRTAEDPDCKKCRDLTLGRAVVNALFVMLPEERDLSGEQKFSRGLLAKRVESDPKAQLSAEEIAVVKRLIGKTYGTAVVVQAYQMLDPNMAPEKLK
jgi:hypothetical protein